jgi:hypothetical protein
MMARKRKVDLPATLVDHYGMAKRVSVKRRHRSIPPTSRATLLCDRVIKDAFTGTVTIVGALTPSELQEFQVIQRRSSCSRNLLVG